MAKMLKHVVSGVFCLLLFGAVLFGGADVSAQESEKPKDLGNWWLRSPLSYDQMPTQCLYHFEGSYDYSRKTGNYTMDNHKADAIIVVRKNRLTNYLNYTFDKRNTSKPNDDLYTENNVNLRNDTKHELTDDLRFALTKRYYIAPGAMWLRDELSMIQDRYTYYLGGGGTLIDTGKYILNFYAAFGHEELDYTDDYHNLCKMVMEGYGVSAEDIDYEEGTVKTEVIYLNQVFNWNITDTLSFNESIDFFQDVNDGDKYRWSLDLSFDIQLMNHVYFSPNYREDYNKNPGLGVRKRDVSIGAGIKISF